MVKSGLDFRKFSVEVTGAGKEGVLYGIILSSAEILVRRKSQTFPITPFSGNGFLSYAFSMHEGLKTIDPRPSRLGRYVALGAVVIIMALTVTKGCEYIPESTFRLASESRLPGWMKIPPGLHRADVSIRMSYYIVPWGGRAVFVLQDANGKTLEKVYGKETCGKPFELKDPPQGFPSGYPGYEVVAVDGVTEIFEQKKPEDILYVTDDPAVWNQYRAMGCD